MDAVVAARKPELRCGRRRSWSFGRLAHARLARAARRGEAAVRALLRGVLHRSDLLGARLASRRRPQTSLAGPLNFLLIGSDARANNPAMGARSDTIIIVHIPATLDRAYLISIPRDLRVDIPPMPDRGFAGALWTRSMPRSSTAAQGAGGVQLLSATLTQLIGIRFDGAAVVDFGGFDKVVEDLGGVHMCIDEPVTLDPHRPRVPPGCQYLTAEQTLDYLRQRETLPNGDFDRQRHQQQFLKAIFAKMFANGLAQNPVKLDQIIRAVGSAMTVDTNGVPLDQLVFTLRNIHRRSLVGSGCRRTRRPSAGSVTCSRHRDADALYAAIDEDTLDATGSPRTRAG